MPFVKGQSGNPGGRPPVNREIQELAREHTTEAVDALVKALKDPKTSVPAAVALLDRGYGKPSQTVNTNISYDPTTMSDHELTRIASAGRNGASAKTNGAKVTH